MLLPKQELAIPVEEGKLSFHEWRDMMERRYDTMPSRYWSDTETMYEEYLNV
tara:strand:+ start:363 stop:518 length:156 start_codon:yes stop_codon:yes gene_type:complete